MEYDRSACALKMSNKTQNTQHTLRNIKEVEGNPLHYCARLWCALDEAVEIL